MLYLDGHTAFVKFGAFPVAISQKGTEGQDLGMLLGLTSPSL